MKGAREVNPILSITVTGNWKKTFHYISPLCWCSFCSYQTVVFFCTVWSSLWKIFRIDLCFRSYIYTPRSSFVVSINKLNLRVAPVLIFQHAWLRPRQWDLLQGFQGLESVEMEGEHFPLPPLLRDSAAMILRSTTRRRRWTQSGKANGGATKKQGPHDSLVPTIHHGKSLGTLESAPKHILGHFYNAILRASQKVFEALHRDTSQSAPKANPKAN
jgi:hypothetical protein